MKSIDINPPCPRAASMMLAKANLVMTTALTLVLGLVALDHSWIEDSRLTAATAATQLAHSQLDHARGELKAIRAELDNARKTLKDDEAALTELEAVRMALDLAQQEAGSSKAEADKLKQTVAALEDQLSALKRKEAEIRYKLSEKEASFSDKKHDKPARSDGLPDYQPKTPSERTDGQYQLTDDAGQPWYNPDPIWLVDWVTAIDLRLKRGPNLVPAVHQQVVQPVAQPAVPQQYVAPGYYYPVYQAPWQSCPTGNCGASFR